MEWGGCGGRLFKEGVCSDRATLRDFGSSPVSESGGQDLLD